MLPNKSQLIAIAILSAAIISGACLVRENGRYQLQLHANHDSPKMYVPVVLDTRTGTVYSRGKKEGRLVIDCVDLDGSRRVIPTTPIDDN